MIKEIMMVSTFSESKYNLLLNSAAITKERTAPSWKIKQQNFDDYAICQTITSSGYYVYEYN